MSGGQLVPTPSQFSVASQQPTAIRQTLPLFLTWSLGQEAEEPVHVSATSQLPADVRHTAELGWNASLGQAVLDPVQCSATSQTPAEARQTVVAGAGPAGWHTGLPVLQSKVPSWHGLPVPHGAPAVHPTTHPPSPSQLPPVQVVPVGAKASTGQVVPVPVQVSATSQVSAAGRQTVLVSAKASGGHAVLVPSQVSATSQGPVAARHSVPAAVGPADAHTGLPLAQSRVPRSQGLPVSQLAPPTHPASAGLASAGPASAGPASMGMPPSPWGTDSQPRSGSQNISAAHPPLMGATRQAPTVVSQRASAQAAAGAGHSDALVQPGVPQAVGFSGEQSGGTHRPPRHSVAFGSSPVPGQLTDRQSRVMITVTPKRPDTSTMTRRWATTPPPWSSRRTSTSVRPPSSPDTSATWRPMRKSSP